VPAEDDVVGRADGVGLEQRAQLGLVARGHGGVVPDQVHEVGGRVVGEADHVRMEEAVVAQGERLRLRARGSLGDAGDPHEGEIAVEIDAVGVGAGRGDRAVRVGHRDEERLHGVDDRGRGGVGAVAVDERPGDAEDDLEGHALVAVQGADDPGFGLHLVGGHVVADPQADDGASADRGAERLDAGDVRMTGGEGLEGGDHVVVGGEPDAAEARLGRFLGAGLARPRGGRERGAGAADGEQERNRGNTPTAQGTPPWRPPPGLRPAASARLRTAGGSPRLPLNQTAARRRGR
jgi:hypothetical protein